MGCRAHHHIAFFTLSLYPSLLRERTDLTCYDAVYDFDAQFLYEAVTEALPAEFNNSTNKFQIKIVNIGWALSKATAGSLLADGESSYDRKIMKCAGALQCINEDCEQGYNVNTRPQLPFISIFTFRMNDITHGNRGSTITMVHNIKKTQHTQRFYKYLHLARWEKKELDKSVKETTNITAAAAIAGIDPATGAIKRSIKNINKVLGKHGCATFEINHSKIKQGIILSANNVVAEFEDL
ncbi:hypothetical protein G6F42_016134 [Rhizopus arrhizus]|nr:hypothetical protein G6F42_016134 [Rhizopus arrhizus]